MTQLPVNPMSSSIATRMGANLPEHLRSVLNKAFLPSMENLASSFNTISFKGNQISLIQSKVVVKSGSSLDFVIINTTPIVHCVWYEQGYDPNAEGVKPTAVWENGGPIPPHVPEWVVKTKDQQGRNWFSYKKRVVVAPVDYTTMGPVPRLDDLYVMDINASSIFGEERSLSLQDRTIKMVSFQAYTAFLLKMNLYPCMLVSHMNIDIQSKAMCTAKFFALTDPTTGLPEMLAPEYVEKIVAIIESGVTDRMLQLDSAEADKALPAPQTQPVQQHTYQQPQTQPVQQPQTQTVYEQPVYEQPVQQPQVQPNVVASAEQQYQQPQTQPVYQQPVQQPQTQPVYQQPVQQPQTQPVYQQPVQQPQTQPVYEQPAQQPTYEQPVQQQPTYQQPQTQPVQQPQGTPVGDLSPDDAAVLSQLQSVLADHPKSQPVQQPTQQPQTQPVQNTQGASAQSLAGQLEGMI